MLCFHAIPPPVESLLKRLADLPGLGDFALGGGTSLALRFGHRVSVDLDFFTLFDFDAGELPRQPGFPDAVQINRSVNSVSLDAAGVKIDFLRHAYPLLEAPEEKQGVRLLALPDVAAMKLNAIANRGAKKDFYDLHELLCHHQLPQLLDWFEAKHRNTDRFTVIRSLAWFEDADAEPDPLSLQALAWPRIKSAVAGHLARL